MFQSSPSWTISLSLNYIFIQYEKRLKQNVLRVKKWSRELTGFKSMKLKTEDCLKKV